MNKNKFLQIVCLMTLVAAVFWQVTYCPAQPNKDAASEESVGRAEQQKSREQRRQEAYDRLAEAVKDRKPKFAEAAAKAGLLVTSADVANQQPQPDAAAAAAITVPNGINPAVDLSLPNWSYSPNLRKFVDGLPGLGYENRNNLGQFIPVAVPDEAAYPGSHYYEIGLKDYNQRMHSDLPEPGTRLRGYYQKNSADPNVTAQQYLGPLILARRDVPVRIKFINELGTGAAGDLFVPVDTTLMGAGMGPNMVMPMSANRVGGAGSTVELMTMAAHNLQVGTLVMLEGFVPEAYNGKFRVTAVPTMMSFRVTLQSDPGGAATTIGHVMEMYSQNRADLHLHGGLTPWISDGTPHQWVTPVGEPASYKKGVGFQNVPDMVGPGKTIPAPAAGDGMGTYYYPNQQSSRLMFYHDHSWGITRLNVYAGEAAGYLVTDQVEDDLIDGTNVSGVFNNVPGNPRPILPDLGGVYRYGIPLVIQDKSFVNDATTDPDPSFATTGATATAKTMDVDPLWYTHLPGSIGGDLWFPHEYLPNENIFDPDGFWLYGRWDYGPWILPPMFPLHDVLPSPSHAPEAFMDTMTVNGTAFPYLDVPRQPVRFRILNACNDRMLNLQLYKADPDNPAEVVMVPAAPNDTYPSWPRDGRDGGVPDPTTAGPDMIQIGNECGFLAKVAVVPAQPVDYDYDRTSATFGNVSSTALWLAPAVRADIIVDFSECNEGDILILYTDAPAPMSLYDGRYDLFTGQQDWTWKGGPPAAAPGFGPNTRTIMQFRVTAGTGQALDLVSLEQALPKAFAVGQDRILVNESAYNAAYDAAYTDIFANIADESMNVLGTPTSVAKIMTEVPGFGYTTPPTVKIYGVGGGSGATAVASLNGVTGVILLTSGSGYTSAPLVTITRAAGDTPGLNATAEALVSGGVVTTIVITSPGSNYLIPPTITLTGGGATVQATAQALLTLGSVGAITIPPGGGGSGYTRPPLVYLVGGGGTGAIAGALLTGGMPFHGKIMVEGMDMEYGRMNAILGSIPNPLNPVAGAGPIVGGNFYIDPPTEIYNDGEVALWRLTHLGVDSHSMHFHLVNVQVINRVDWTNTKKAPFDEEIGWKETIRTAPFEDIILALKPVKINLPFGIPESNRLLDPSSPEGSTAMFQPVIPPIGIPAVAQLSNVMTNFGQEYVWHCHLLGHEENDMMRPFVMKVASAPPTAPSLAVPTLATGVVSLSWTDPTPASSPSTMGDPANEIGFRVQRVPGTSGGTFVTIAEIAANSTAYSDTPPQGQTYRYRIQIYNAAGTANSNTRTITVSAQVPAAPSGLTGAMSAQPPLVVNLQWTDNATNETGYAIQRATNASFSSGVTNFTAPANATSFANTITSTTMRTYYYRVRATVGTTVSPWSNTASVLVARPSAPSNLAASLVATPLGISLSWRDNSTVEAGFTLQRSTSSTFSPAISIAVAASPASGATVTYLDNAVLPNTRYYYRVLAFNGAANSAWSNSVNLLTPGEVVPGVTIVDNGQPGTSFTGTWQVSGAAGAYGTNSLWSYNGATYTWSFTPTTTGSYRVSLWWTQLSARYTAVPVAITHAGGTANMTVNQTTNGGMWNVMGTYTLNAGTAYTVRITAVPPVSPPSTSADAVRWEQL